MAFPRLTHLMGAYLNQDFDIHDETVEEVLAVYVRTNWADDVGATVAEIDRLLAGPVEGLLARFQSEVSRWDLSIGGDDGEARTWLTQARAVLTAGLERGEAQERPQARP